MLHTEALAIWRNRIGKQQDRLPAPSFCFLKMYITFGLLSCIQRRVSSPMTTTAQEGCCSFLALYELCVTSPTCKATLTHLELQGGISGFPHLRLPPAVLGCPPGGHSGLQCLQPYWVKMPST